MEIHKDLQNKITCTECQQEYNGQGIIIWNKEGKYTHQKCMTD